jgi:hypothetical protein
LASLSAFVAKAPSATPRSEIEKEAKGLLTALRGTVTQWLEVLEGYSLQTELVLGVGELRVLLREVQHEGAPCWVAHALELGVVSQAKNASEAIDSAVQFAAWQKEDIATGEYLLPPPAIPELFQEFRAGTNERVLDNILGFRTVVVRQG